MNLQGFIAIVAVDVVIFVIIGGCVAWVLIKRSILYLSETSRNDSLSLADKDDAAHPTWDIDEENQLSQDMDMKSQTSGDEEEDAQSANETSNQSPNFLEALKKTGMREKASYTKKEAAMLVHEAVAIGNTQIHGVGWEQEIKEVVTAVPTRPVSGWTNPMFRTLTLRLLGQSKDRQDNNLASPSAPKLIGSGGTADAYAVANSVITKLKSVIKICSIAEYDMAFAMAKYEGYIKEANVHVKAMETCPEYVVHLFDVFATPPTETEEMNESYRTCAPVNNGLPVAQSSPSRTHESGAPTMSKSPAMQSIISPGDNVVTTYESQSIQATVQVTTSGGVFPKTELPAKQPLSVDSPGNKSEASFSDPKVPIKGVVCIVLERCDGTLRDRLEGMCQLGLSPVEIFEKTLTILARVAEGIQKLNSGGIEHGDVTWENIFFAKRGHDLVPVLGDFGLANSPSANDVRYMGFVLYDMCNEILSCNDDNDVEHGKWDDHKWSLERQTRSQNGFPDDWAGRLRELNGWFNGFDEILEIILAATASDNKDLMTAQDFHERLSAVCKKLKG